MIKMVKWPSIEQFRNVVKNVQHKARFKGLDENGEAIYDPFAKLPILRFQGTVKLHGTNASVAMTSDGEMWCQSRENIITPQKDNAGFAMFVEGRKDDFNDLLLTARGVFGHNTIPNAYLKDIVVWGEWCGAGIQKNIAISDLPKMFVIFGIALVDEEGHKTYFTKQQVIDTVDGCREYVLRPNGKPEATAIYCIWDFETFEMMIDFENPHESQNNLNAITEAVEHECPVGQALGVVKAEDVNTVGEGVVWRCVDQGFEDSGFWFKVKGDKHSNSKVKTLATVDVEKINNIKALAEKLVHEGRLEQATQNVFDTLNGGEVDIKRVGEMIKWVMSDVWKEESDTIAASGFTMKELNGPISKIIRDFVMKAV